MLYGSETSQAQNSKILMHKMWNLSSPDTSSFPKSGWGSYKFCCTRHAWWRKHKMQSILQSNFQSRPLKTIKSLIIDLQLICEFWLHLLLFEYIKIIFLGAYNLKVQLRIDFPGQNGDWHNGQVDLWEVENHLYRQAEWNLCLQVLHARRGRAWLTVWMTL